MCFGIYTKFFTDPIQTKNNIGLQIPLVILIVILVIVFINLSYILLKTFILNKKGYYIASFRVISTLFLTKSMYHDVFNDITDNFKDDWLPPRTNGNPLLIVFYLSVPIFLIEEGKDASKDEWYSFIKFMLFTIWYWVFCWISGVVLLFIRFICHWKLRVNDQKIKKILESE